MKNTMRTIYTLLLFLGVSRMLSMEKTGFLRNTTIDLSLVPDSSSTQRNDTHGYSLSLTYSLDNRRLEEERVREVRDLCSEEYVQPRHMSILMLDRVNRVFELPVALVFLDYTADLNYVLGSLLRGEEALSSSINLRNAVLFALNHGATWDPCHNQALSSIIQEDSIFQALTNEEDKVIEALRERFRLFNSNEPGIGIMRKKIERELRELFLVAAGQQKNKIVYKILELFGHLIINDLMQEAFIAAAYTGNTELLAFFYGYNASRIQSESSWRETLSYALRRAVTRTILYNDVLALRFILQQERNFSLDGALEHVEHLQSIRNTPQDVLERYREILNLLYEKACLPLSFKAHSPLLFPTPIIIQEQSVPDTPKKRSSKTVLMLMLKNWGKKKYNKKKNT